MVWLAVKGVRIPQLVYIIFLSRADFYGEDRIVMQDKVYVVNYYMDYERHGFYAIFKNKEDAESCAKILTEHDEDIDCRYDVCESTIYKSLDEALKE